MKEVKTTSVILICCAILLGSFSCRHETASVIDSGNRVIPMQTGEKTANEYMCIVSLGHDANGCPGCVLVQGKYMHFDCQGRGNACRVTAAVTLNQGRPARTLRRHQHPQQIRGRPRPRLRRLRPQPPGYLSSGY